MTTATASPGINPWTASFRSRDLEDGFRQSLFTEDRRHLTLAVLLVNAGSAVFAITDLEVARELGGAHLLLWLRGLFLVLSTAGLVALWKQASGGVVDWVVFGLALACGAMAIVVALSRPDAFTSTFAAETVLIVGLYVLVPNRFLLQVVPAALLSAGVVIVVILSAPAPALSRAVILSVACANVLGGWLCWRSHTQRRVQFYLLRRERALHASLREAERTRRTLEGMLAICASCKKIRDDAGYWRQVEQYVGERANVVFSHGICPDCAGSLYADEAEDR